jgi:hypothetical protein
LRHSLLGRALTLGINHADQPFNTGGSLLAYAIQPGSYNFRVIDPADASREIRRTKKSSLGMKDFAANSVF